MSNSPRRLKVNDVAVHEVAITMPQVPSRLVQAVNKAVAIEHGRGMVRAARVRGLEYATYEALQATAGLTELEALYLQRAPLGENRYKAIVDTAAVILANIVAEAGRD